MCVTLFSDVLISAVTPQPLPTLVVTMCLVCVPFDVNGITQARMPRVPSQRTVASLTW